MKATIRISEIKDDAAFREAVVLLTQHSGRIFFGTSPKNREELPSLGDAILLLVSEHNARGDGKLYLTPRPNTRAPNKQSQWNEACNAAREGLKQLASIQLHHEEWRERLRQTSGSQSLKDKLDQVIRIDIESAERMLDEAIETELPKGYGRD